MAEISTRWWGIVVELTRDEACVVAAPRTELMQIFNIIPPPFGQLVGLAVGAAKAAMRNAVGDEGLSLHVNWAGVPHWFGARGNPAPCAAEAFGVDGEGLRMPRRLPLEVQVTQPNAAQQAALQPVVDPTGVFRVTGTDCYEETTEEGLFSIEFTNLSGEWVSVDVVRPDGSIDRSGRIPHGEQGAIDNIISAYKGGQNVVNRWRPGFLGLPGTGGGRIEFTVPGAAGAGYIRFNIIG